MNRRSLLAIFAALPTLTLFSRKSWRPITPSLIINCAFYGRGSTVTSPRAMYEAFGEADGSVVTNFCFRVTDGAWYVATAGRVFRNGREVPFKTRTSRISCNDCILVEA